MESVIENKKANVVSAPINHPRINGLLGISDKLISVSKGCDKSHRFSLELFLPDEKEFPEFDYNTLVKDMGNGGAESSKNKFSDTDSDGENAQLKALAQKFEEKYAPKKKESGKKYKDEYIDCGYGYDESDTFIDNSEAYDEVVPSDWTTEHGGFYINQGNLDFRPCTNLSDNAKKDQSVYKKKKKKKLLDGKSHHKNPKELTTQKKKIQLLNKEKQRKRQESLQKATKILVKKSKKTATTNDDVQDKENNSIQEDAKMSNSFEDNLPLAVIAKSSEDDEPLAKLSSSFEENIPLAEIAAKSLPVPSGTASLKSISHNSNSVIIKSSTPAKLLPSSNGVVSTKNISNNSSSNVIIISSPAKTTTCTIVSVSSTKVSSSPLNTILGKKSNNNSITSPTNLNSSLLNKSSDDNEETKRPKVIIPLPDAILSNELKADIQTLKDMAAAYVKGKGFFTTEVNKVLLSFARYCRQLSPKIRNGVYDHLLCFIPCARDTLVKRCRRLIVQHQRDMEDEPIRVLKKAIDDSMLGQRKEYDEEVAEALQEQAREQIKQTGVDPMKAEVGKEGMDEEKKIIDEPKKFIPKKKYEWSDEIRSLLCGVVKVRVGLYKMSKSKSMTAEEYVKDFLESEIRKLWPKGWMTSRILYKESRAAHLEITQPIRGKSKLLPSGHPIADVRNGSYETVSPNILRSGPKNPGTSQPTVLKALPKTPTSTPVSISIATSSIASSPSVSVTTNHVICNGVMDTLTLSKQSPSCGIKIVPKSIIKTIASVTNAKIGSVSATTNLLTITKPISTTTTVFGNIIVSNASAYTLPKSSTAVTWNTSSQISTTCVSPQKHLVAMNKLPSNLKIVSHGAKGKTSGEISARFAETLEKSTFLKSEQLEDVTKRPTPLKVDSLLLTTSSENAINVFRSSTPSSSPCSTAPNNFPRSNIMQQKVVSQYAIASTFAHPTNSLHSNTQSDAAYFRQQVKRKLPVETNDIRNPTQKRNLTDKHLVNHASKSTEGKSWMEIESDLVRLSQEAQQQRKVKEEPSSPDSGVSSGKSPDCAMKGKEWCSYASTLSPHASPRATLVHISQAKLSSPQGTRSVDALTKSKASRLQSMYRPIDAPMFDTDGICRKTVPNTASNILSCQQQQQQSTSNQNKYVLSNKQLSPQSQLLSYQQSNAIPYSKPIMQLPTRKSSASQLSIKSSSKNTTLDANMRHDYLLPQHPASRIQLPSSTKSDHQYSTSFDNNTRGITETHGALQVSHPITNKQHDSHNSKDKISPIRLSQHIAQPHGIHAGINMQGKFIGLQPVNQSISSHQAAAHNRLSIDEQLQPREGSRNEQEYQSKFGTYTQRFS